MPPGVSGGHRVCVSICLGAGTGQVLSPRRRPCCASRWGLRGLEVSLEQGQRGGLSGKEHLSALVQKGVLGSSTQGRYLGVETPEGALPSSAPSRTLSEGQRPSRSRRLRLGSSRAARGRPLAAAGGLAPSQARRRRRRRRRSRDRARGLQPLSLNERETRWRLRAIR